MEKNEEALVVVRNATVIDGTGNAPFKAAEVRVRGNRIEQVLVQSQGATAGIGTATEIDGTGSFLLPGLIDGHCHISLHQGAVPGVSHRTGAEFGALWAAHAASRVLRSGWTGISVPGGKWFIDVAVRDAVTTGFIEGPRIFAAGRAITTSGGIFNTRSDLEQEPPDSAGVVCNTAEEATAQVRRQAARGVDMIKVADSFWGDIQTLDPSILEGIVQEAHRRDVRVCIHARGAASTRAAAKAGVDWIFHADLATEDDLRAMVEHGVPLMPVLTAPWVGIEYARECGVSPADRERLQRQLDLSVEMIRKAIGMGIKLMVGSDSGNASAFEHGRWHAKELELLVDLVGISALQAIRAATCDNAQVIGLDGKVGTVEAGMLADLVLWKKNPLTDIRVLQDSGNINSIIKDGRLMDLAAPTYPILPQAGAFTRHGAPQSVRIGV